MTITVQDIDAWLGNPEDEHLEFKEAKNSYDFDKLVLYCAALANEGGGSIVFGVTDRAPRRVVGTKAFSDLQQTQIRLLDKLRIRVDAEVVGHPHGRVVVFRVPRRPLGTAVSVDGAYWMRSGESLVPMTDGQLQQIFSEAVLDYSATICAGATIQELDVAAIEDFRQRWHRKSKNAALLGVPIEQLLRDAELVSDKGVTYAALILLGKREALGRHLAAAEVVFEYRSTDAPGPANQREQFREGFLLFYDRLWELINLRNDRQHYQDGLFMVDVKTFSEAAVREAVLNAVAHRDYQHPGSVFVRQYPRRIEIVSPGGLPEGVTPENILDRQLPRNRRVAETLERCGLVERAGQGANRMFESSIREGKDLPDFSQTDARQVGITLHGELRDPRFVRFLEAVGKEVQASFDTHDLLLLDAIHREQPIPASLIPRVPRLRELGIIENVGRGRGVRHLLSRRFYSFLGQDGAYTRRRGLDRETNKALLLRHLEVAGQNGSGLAELQEVLPNLSLAQIQGLLREMKDEGRAAVRGTRRWARWLTASAFRAGQAGQTPKDRKEEV